MTLKKEAKRSSKKGKSTHNGTNYNDESTNVTHPEPTRECKQTKPEAGAQSIRYLSFFAKFLKSISRVSS